MPVGARCDAAGAGGRAHRPGAHHGSRYASGGSGAYLGSIDWFEWGANGVAIPAAGLTKTNTRVVAGGTLATTCVISNLSGALSAYRPGSWSGDGLDDLYNVGGTGTSNQLIIGLSNTTQGTTVTFSLACSTTLDGNPVPLAGLVMADAEQSGSNEYVQATVPAGGEWRLIDRIRTAGCSKDTAVSRTGQTLRMTGPTDPLCGTGPDGVAFMDGATSADVAMKGGGKSAIALGVMLFNDFGDAPASYGDAAALYSPAFAGGTVPEGSSTVFGATLNTPTQPTTRLGATVDSESSQQASAGATGDGADEDGVGALATLNAVPGAAYTLPSVSCTGPGSVAGWIDWNRNGTFDSGERSGTATCSGSSVSLSWTVPADVRSGATFLRLRIGPNAASVAGPTGVTTAGEVEDHPLAVLAPADLGDAPASFGTTIAGNGPRHDVPGYDAGAHTAPLMLGAGIDTDADGTPGAAADGDDATGVDDEDALNSLSLAPGGTTASATVPVVNTSGAAATLYGWIDANGNGSFQAGEAATVNVPNGATSATLSWTGLTAFVDAARPVVRLRLTSATLTDTAGTAALDERSQGAAPDGEVEDLLATVGAAPPTSCTDPFVENFGTGGNYGPQLAAGQTTYGYVSSGVVQDGNYAIMSQLPGAAGGWWLAGEDHTPGDTNGRMMLINAAFAAGSFFSKTFTGLSAGTQYDFSAWITNANNGNPILPNVTFRVVDPVSGAVLGTVSTGDMPRTPTLTWNPFSLKFTATQPTVRLELVNNAPGGNGNDLAIDDIALAAVCEHGDAPDSYATLLASNGPVHGRGAPHLGGAVDYEGDGLPTVAADGDDLASGDDEDGVTFNPALSYPNPTIRTGTDPVTLLPVQNTVRVNASGAGFASVWVDWNEDGDFADAGERVADAQAVAAGNNDLTFAGAANPADIRTYVRVRYSTDAASVHAPTGVAPDGEVEDYRVLVERLIVPSACAPVSQPFYAMTFKAPLVADETAATVRYRDVTVVGGRAVDMFVSAGGAFAANSFDASGDDAAWNVNGSSTLDYTFYLAGTTTPVQVSGVWGVDDMDSGESTSYLTNQIAGYAITPGSKVSVTTGVNSQSQPFTRFSGTVSGNSAPESRYQLWFQGRSTLSASWGGGTNSGFTIDGDTDLSVPPSCEDYGDAPDVGYKTLLASNGPHHSIDLGLRLGAAVEFDGDGQPTAGADGDDLNRTDDEDGVAAPIVETVGQTTTVQVSATNSTASAATLAGWIDVNVNGTFDAGERATVSVPAASGTATYTLTFPAASILDDTYARFRLFPGAPANPLPTGAATAGEVEDYRVTATAPVVSCATDAALFNTAYNGAGGKLPAGSRDLVWRAGLGNATGPASVSSWIPAYVVTGPSAWTPSPFGNADWISYFANTAQGAGNADVYFRYTFTIDPNVALNGFSLPMDFYADNSVPEVWVNGVAQSAFTTSLPQSTNTYFYAGFQAGKQAATMLSHGFQHGSNTIVVRVASGPPNVGFMAQMNPTAVCADRGDAPASYGTAGSGGPSHNLAGYNGTTHTAPLMMGALVDSDTDGQPGAAADGDDTISTDDEDGVGPITVTKGVPSTITVNATNTTASAATLAGWVDLDKSGTFDSNERVVVSIPAGSPAASYQLAFPAATTTQPMYARFRLLPGTVATPSPTSAATAGEVEDYPVTVLNTSAAVTKTSDATASSKPGDTVTYTVTLTNTGTGAYTVANPARLVDDLTDVLDDGTYQANAAATVDGAPVTAPTYAAPRISWSGPLAAGKSVVVTYSVVLQGGGDGHVRNTAFAPLTSTPGTTPDCSTPGAVPCDTEVFELPKLSITKAANRTALPAVGQTIVYTVTVKNTGLGAFTAAHPATFSDDLSAVLDDTQPLTAGNITATTGTASFASPTLSWTGALPAGQSATISYTLTYTGAGDHVLVNNACVPTAEATDQTDTCRTVSVPGSGLNHHKSVDPVSGTSVDVGQVLTYTLTFENVGPVAATVDTTDDLSDVLDDAQLVGTPVAGAGLTAAVAGTDLEITGSVPAGATRTVTYQVQVRPYPQQGDHLLANVLACEPGEPTGCAPETTSNPVRHLTLTKTSDATVDSKPGDVVTYTVTATNDGAGDWTATDPTTVVDDLTGLLDDATYGEDATASSGAVPTYAAPRITWTGPLGHGDSVTIEYTVTLTGGGDGHVDNVVWQPVDPGNPGPTPDCATTQLPCAEHGSELPKLTIKKTSNRAQLPAAGQKITYTVTVTNPGPGDYTPAHPATFADDLTDVLDDASFDVGSITVTTGAAALNGNNLDWAGVLTAGQSATVTYTLTYLGVSPPGNLVVDNHACIPVQEAKDPADVCRTVHTPGSGLRHFKSVDPANGASVVEGQVLTYTLTFENVGPAAATVATFDDLSEVADDAVLDTGSITADAGLTATPNGAGDRIDITGVVPSGDTLTVTYQVTVKAYADQGDHLVTNALACETGDPQPCDPTSTTNPVRHLTVTKTSDATVDSKPGDTVSYTVRLVNDGTGDYTALDPATLVDDLTGVLDDATFNGVAHASAGPDPTYTAPRITWAGPLAAGDEVRVTYEVVLKGGGDGHVDNVAWVAPDPGNPGPTPNCAAPATTFPCDGESFDLPKLTIIKDADRTELSATGQQVTYTITVSNPGPGDYTAAHPATFTDDLSDVLDDATVDPASITGGATLTGSTLSWSGPLAAGATADVTYVATYRGTGDHSLDNRACIPDEEAAPNAGSCSLSVIPGSGLTHAKSVSPASGTPVQVGQVLTYTLTFQNAGAVPADVNTSDDLSGVLDDADLVAGSVTAGGGLNATVNGNSLDVTGTVLGTATVTYQVTVKPFGQQGDHVLTNALACEPGDPAPCTPETTTNPVAHLMVDKSSNRTVDSKPGDTITYTVTATNDGPGDFPVGAPATVVDDLAGVLDDATYGNDAVAKIGAVTVSAPTYAAPRVTWSGALGHGETVTVTYTVVLKGGGDGVVRNVAWAPDGPPGPTPDCAASPLPCATESFDLPKLTVAKSASRADLPATGQTITYTVVVTNSGPGDYTAAHPATLSDDLSDVLDDATVGSVSATVGAASITGTTLSWSGVLTAGASSTITYSFTYRATGDHELDNTACVPASEAQVPADACDTVSVPGSGLVQHKSVNPAAGTPVEVGDVLTYTLTFDNTAGATAATVNTSDDLSDVLDDADLVVGSVTAGGGLNATVNGNSLDVTGTVPAGATRTVTYQVTVRPFGQQGDHVLTNALACEPGEPAPCTPETTTNPVAHLVIDKSSNRTVDSKPGDTITYTVTATNDGPGDFTAADQASVVDDLTGVLDDADYDNNATADRGGVPTYAAPRITWVGALTHGDTVTITYTVVLKGGGDGVVRNVAWQPVDPGNPGPTPDCAATARPCDTSSFDLPKLTITKAANRTGFSATGQTVTYTIVVTNPGPGDYTAAHLASFSDNLSDVVDDAVIDPASVTATSGTATYAGALLVWTGVLPATGTATITYTATYRATGNHVLVNTACVPAAEALDAADACDGAQVVGSSLTHAKSVTPASGTPVEVGDLLTYTLTFTNTGTVPADVNTSDDLSGVLDDADLVAGSVTAGAGLNAVPSGNNLNVIGTVPAGATRTVTYQVTVKPFAQQGDHVLANALACEPGDPLPCTPETTTNPVAHLVIDKSSNRTLDSKPGDTITYTVTATNDGPGDFTAADQASVVDDLSGVLDDANYDNNATADRGGVPTYAAPRITWVGALTHGDTVTITYTVVLKGGGDGVVRNVAWQPVDPNNPGPTPDCAATARPCDTSSFDLPKLTVAKSASRANLPATGQTITYTVVVTNPGPGDYTAAHPATLSDDLSDVLDDATVGSVSATVGAASITGTTLSWSGVLTAGASSTITYSFTYRATGDHELDNTACVPASEAQVPADACDTVSVPGSGLVHHKSVSPAAGTAVEVGDVLTYTLTFDNTAGKATATVDTSDDLSAVLDDATLDTASITAGPGLNAVPAGNSLDVTGSVPAGATRTVTYQVTVKPFAQQGDHVITNALACEPGEPAPCAPETTTNPVRHLVLTKVKTSPVAPDTGDTVTYTLTVANDGAGDWTAGDPATFVDDLTDVVDDATWDNTATASGGTVSYTSPTLTWSGALAHGTTVTVTYGVTVTNLGDHELANTASVPGCQLPECTPPTVVTPLPHVVPSKTSVPATGQPVQPGDRVTYTLSWTNDGTAPGVVDSTDDLTRVLDDADVVTEPTSSDPAVIATRTGATLRVVGPIADGDTVTVTYAVRVKPSGQHGDNNLANVLAQDTPQVTCPPFPCTPVPPPGTQHTAGDLDDWKTVDPATGSTVRAGTRLTYTLHFASTGTAAVDVDRVDDLSGVLDDATLVAGPTSSAPALTATGPTAGRIAVTGTLPPGTNATVSYTVEVKPNGQRGNDQLGNFLLAPGQPTPTSCTGPNPARLDCTLNHVSDIEVTKTSSPKSGGKVDIGDTITYTLTFHNVSTDPNAAPAPVDQVDHLDDVLDDASWATGPMASNSALTATRTGDQLHVTGSLASGQTVTVTYKVKVHGKGNRKVRNVVAPAGEAPVCAADSPTCTSQGIRPQDETGDGGGDDPDHGNGPQHGDLPDTGSSVPPWLPPLGVLCLLLGVVLIRRSRRAS